MSKLKIIEKIELLKYQSDKAVYCIENHIKEEEHLDELMLITNKMNKLLSSI